MLSVLFISLSKSVFKHSLSQKVSLLSKKLLLLLSYSFIFMVVQQWHYWKKWALTRKKNMRTGFEKLKTPHNFSLLTFRQIHIIWTQLLILRRNEADAQKYLQYSHRIPEGRTNQWRSAFCLFLLLPLSLPRRRKNSISTILLSLSLFCLFVTQTFLLPFPRSSSSAFTGRAILAGITRTPFFLCTCYEPTLARACIAHSVHGTNFGLD